MAIRSAIAAALSMLFAGIACAQSPSLIGIPQATDPACASGEYWLAVDGINLVWTKCEDGAISNLDTGSGGGGGGAPDNATYLTGTSNGTLTNEIVVGSTPGGELGGTWGTPTLDDNVTVTGWNLGTLGGAFGLGGAIDANSYGITELGDIASVGQGNTFYPTVNVSSVGPGHTRPNYFRNWLSLRNSGSASDKPQAIGIEQEFLSNGQGEGHGIWTTAIGGGSSDLVGLFQNTLNSGPALTSGDEGVSGQRGRTADFYYHANGTTTGTLAAGANTTSVTVGSLTETESMVIGDGKLAVFNSSASAADVTISTPLPPATAVSGSITAGWTGTGSGGTEGVWTLGAGQVGSTGVGVGWCFSADDADYNDPGGISGRQWLYITAVDSGLDTIRTEWIAQGTDTRVPYGYAASAGANQGRVAPCAKLSDPVYGSDFVADTVTMTTGSGHPSLTNPAFTVSSYGVPQVTAVRQYLSIKNGYLYPASGFLIYNDIAYGGRYQADAAFRATFTGSLSSLVDGEYHAFQTGLDCYQAGACENGLEWRAVDTAGLSQYPLLIDWGTTRWAAGDAFTVIRNAQSSSFDLRLDPDLGYMQGSTPFALTTGSKTTDNCAKWDASGRVVDAGAPCGGGGGSSLPVSDGTSIVEGSADSTKEIRFEADGIATGTVRTITMPDFNVDLGNLIDSQISDTLTASIFKGSGTTTDAVDLATAEVAGLLTVAKGGNGSAPASDDQVVVSSSTSAAAWKTLPDSDGATQKLQYDQTTNAFSAGTDDDVPDSGDFGNATDLDSVGAVKPNAVALGTDTTGNYVATIADSGAAEVTVSGSGSEGAAVTLAIASTITRDSELPVYTVGTSDPTDGSTACATDGELYWNKTGHKFFVCADAATDDWWGVAMVDTP